MSSAYVITGSGIIILEGTEAAVKAVARSVQDDVLFEANALANYRKR